MEVVSATMLTTSRLTGIPADAATSPPTSLPADTGTSARTHTLPTTPLPSATSTTPMSTRSTTSQAAFAATTTAIGSSTTSTSSWSSSSETVTVSAPSGSSSSPVEEEAALEFQGFQEEAEQQLAAAEELLARTLPELAKSNRTTVPVEVAAGVAVATKLKALSEKAPKNSSRLTIPVEEAGTAVTVPLSIFEEVQTQGKEVVLAITMFDGPDVPPDALANIDSPAQALATATIDLVYLRSGEHIDVTDLEQPIEFSLPTDFLPGMACAYWTGQVWSTRGVGTKEANALGGGHINCTTTHLSLFGALWAGFKAALECSQIVLLSEEGLSALALPEWPFDAGSILFWCMSSLMLAVFIAAAIVDAYRARWVTWSNDFFLIPPPVTPLECMGTVSTDAQCAQTKGCLQETACVNAVDEILSTWFEYFSDVRSFIDGIWGSMDCGHSCRLMNAVQRVTSLVLLACCRRLASSTMGVSEDAVKFVLEDSGFKRYIRQLKQGGCEEASGMEAVPAEPHIRAFPTHSAQGEASLRMTRLSAKNTSRIFGGSKESSGWHSRDHREEAWVSLHEEISQHLQESIEYHSWRKMHRMIPRLFVTCSPYRQVFAISIFSSCKFRAFFLMVELSGVLMVTCLFFATGNVRGRVRSSRQNCENGELQKTWAFLLGRAIAVSICSVLLSWVPKTFLLSLHTVGFRTLEPGSSEAKRQLRAWATQDRIIWVLGSLYIAANVFFILLFLSNIGVKDHKDFALSGTVSILQEGILLPLGLSAVLPLLAMLLMALAGWLGQLDHRALINNVEYMIATQTNAMGMRLT